MNAKWDHRFMRMATEAATWSKDPDAKVGVFLVAPDRRQFSCGYNGFPAGVQDDYLGLSNAEKNELTVHAERNAILNARRDVSGWTLYTTKPPCFECCKDILQAGIARVVVPSESFLTKAAAAFLPTSLAVHKESKWADSQRRGRELLIKHGVVYSARSLSRELEK